MTSIIIYAAVGYHVFHHRNQLRALESSQDDKVSPISASFPESDAGDGGDEVSLTYPSTSFYIRTLTNAFSND